MSHQATKEPFIFIIFGASGDLAKIKIFPALYDLFCMKKFDTDFYIYGFARSEKSHEQFQKEFSDSVKAKRNQVNEEKLNLLISKINYVQGEYSDSNAYEKLFKEFETLNIGNFSKKIAYFSVPPQIFAPIIQNLGEIKKDKNENIQLVIEKPFGEDGHSAKELLHQVSNFFDEEKDIYLLDHYLGKRGVQSILPLRADNSILNLMINGRAIKNIQITAFEDTGIVDRAGYFDKVGILKDMIQSHILQILALITMSIPVVKSPRNIHREKFSILSALRYEEGVGKMTLGQYQSYRTEKNVPPNSITPTFTALKLYIDRLSWYKVPIYIRTGKKLKKKLAYIVIEFKKLPFQEDDKNIPTNKLIIELQPDEKVEIRLVKTKEDETREKSIYDDIITSDSLACRAEEGCLDEYGRLILEMLNNDKTHFLSFEEIIECWRLVDYLYKCIDREDVQLTIYKDNSNGPDQQNTLTRDDGNEWYEV